MPNRPHRCAEPARQPVNTPAGAIRCVLTYRIAADTPVGVLLSDDGTAGYAAVGTAVGFMRYAGIMSNNEQEDDRPNLEVPDHLNYSDEHVWVDESVEPAAIGITEYAANQLGDLVFVDLPEVGTRVEAGDEIVELESSKAVEPLVCPVAGTIRYVNRDVADDPGVINNDPYGEGWIVKIELDDDEPDLLSADEYAAILRRL